MPSKAPKDYTQAEVAVWLNSVGLGSKTGAFAENAIDGPMLVTLTEEDLTASMGFTSLQARKFKQSLEFATGLAEGGGGGGGNSEEVASLKAEIAKMQEEIANLKAINKELADQLAPEPAPAPAPAPAYAPAPAPRSKGPSVAGGAVRGVLLIAERRMY
ncbi:MAG: hypothetical protein SGILL_001531 [Bacillariaceae sp.]